MAALVLRASMIVSIRSRSTPPSMQAADLIDVGGLHLVERDVAERRVVDVGRDRERAVRRSDRAGDESRPPGIATVEILDGGARDARPLEVQLVDERFEAVVGLRHGVRVERVRLDDVGAGLEVLPVDAADDVRTRQHEHVVVALEIDARDPRTDRRGSRAPRGAGAESSCPSPRRARRCDRPAIRSSTRVGQSCVSSMLRARHPAPGVSSRRDTASRLAVDPSRRFRAGRDEHGKRIGRPARADAHHRLRQSRPRSTSCRSRSVGEAKPSVAKRRAAPRPRRGFRGRAPARARLAGGRATPQRAPRRADRHGAAPATAAPRPQMHCRAADAPASPRFHTMFFTLAPRGQRPRARERRRGPIDGRHPPGPSRGLDGQIAFAAPEVGDVERRQQQAEGARPGGPAPAGHELTALVAVRRAAMKLSLRSRRTSSSRASSARVAGVACLNSARSHAQSGARGMARHL